MPDVVEFAGLRAEPGEKVYGSFEAASAPAGAIRIPAAIVNGQRPGPTLAVTAGVHGTEYPGIEAAQRIYRQTQPEQLSGCLVMFPLINVPGFEAGATNVNPIDNQNLNRVCPGSPTGSASQVMVYRVLEQLSARAQYHVDLHGGDSSELLRPFAIFRTSDDAQVQRSGETMARLYDTELVWASNAIVGNAGTLTGEMVRRGIPAIVGEAGYLGTYNEEEVAVHLKGVRNIMKHLGMLEGEPELTVGSRQQVFSQGWAVDAPCAGIFYPAARPGDLVEAGQVLGTLKNVAGETVAEVQAPARGLVRVMFPRRSVYSGMPLYKGWVRQ